MSVPTANDYPYAGPADQCPSCFAANKTPEYLVAFVQGIFPTNWWFPGDPACPNVLCKMAVTMACNWTGNIGFWEFSYVAGPLGASFGIRRVGFYQAFDSGAQPVGQFNFVNTLGIGAPQKYSGGRAFITNLADADCFSELDLMELITIPPADDTWCNIACLDLDSAVHKYYSKVDRINIHILHDHT